MKQSISILSVCLILITQLVWVQASYADIASTKTIIQSNELIGQQTVSELLNREQAKSLLQAYGVDEKQLENRINKLTAEELALINEKINELPAGAGALGTIVLIFVVLIALDLLGATNIFSAIQPIN